MGKYQEALERIKASGISKNHQLVYIMFADRGIDPANIDPKENVLTFDAWRAKGRTVRKGEHGVKIPVFIKKTEKDKDGKEEHNSYLVTSAVFHESQTEPWDGKDYEPKSHGENGNGNGAKIISAKFRSACDKCSASIQRGDQIAWYRSNKAVECLKCYESQQVTE